MFKERWAVMLTRAEAGACSLRLLVELDLATAEEVQREVVAYAERLGPGGTLELDVNQRFVDVCGVAALARTAQLVQGLGCQLRIEGLGPSMKLVLAVGGIPAPLVVAPEELCPTGREHAG